MPQRAYLLDGIMMQIPTNYDGYNHTYWSPTWDGTFYIQWTNNPAWILYNLLVNERWGLGRFLDVNVVDKWSFYEAAVYNDNGVPDGKGGYEFRHRLQLRDQHPPGRLAGADRRRVEHAGDDLLRQRHGLPRAGQAALLARAAVRSGRR